ncbi:MAG: four helix bundle protein [Jaaginema sp. PMC 1079.18]|nr:four helix bundle protein [Jaaginema sp. PMC 1080.18]MEC4853995.1 four helix bundle protein [Jaaginema sp. PMC 1079.18]
MTYSQPDICQRTYQFAVRIVKLCQFLDQNPGVSRTLAQQLLRSGTSIGANLREAQSAESKRDFFHKLKIALKEARETEYWLDLLIDSELVPPNRIKPLRLECRELCRILIASTKKLNNTK